MCFSPDDCPQVNNARVECTPLEKQSEGQKDVSNVCVLRIKCNDNSQCPSDEICIDGTCRLNTNECIDDIQCRNNQYCDKMTVPHKCRHIICIYDEDCKKKRLECILEKCETVTNACKTDCDCKEDELCRPTYDGSEKKCVSVSCDSSLEGYVKCINLNSKCMGSFCISNCQKCCRKGLNCNSFGNCESTDILHSTTDRLETNGPSTVTDGSETVTDGLVTRDEICRNPNKICNGERPCLARCRMCCKKGKTCGTQGICVNIKVVTKSGPDFTSPSTETATIDSTCSNPSEHCKGKKRCIRGCLKCCKKGNQECDFQGICRTRVSTNRPNLETTESPIGKVDNCAYCENKTEICKNHKCVPIEHCENKCENNGNCVYEWDQTKKDYDGKCVYPLETCAGKCDPHEGCSLSTNCTKEQPPCPLKCIEGYKCNPTFRTCTLEVANIGCNNIKCSDGEVCTKEAM